MFSYVPCNYFDAVKTSFRHRAENRIINRGKMDRLHLINKDFILDLIAMK